MYCTNCGKKIPDGSGPLCEACAAEKLSNAARSAAPKTASQLLKSGGKTAAKAARSGIKTGLKAKLLATVAGVTAACAMLGFGAYAVFGETKQEKIWHGMGDVLTLEEQYTILDLAADISAELGAFSREGGTKLSAQVTLPDQSGADLDLTLKRNGKKNLISLSGNLLGVSLEPSKLYFDGKQAAFDLLGADQYFSVKYEDLAKSLVASDAMTAEDAEALWDSTVALLTDNADLHADLKEALEDCVEDTLPRKLGQRDGKTDWAGGRYTAYSLRMDSDQAIQFLKDLGDRILADETLRPWINQSVRLAQQNGELAADYDLNNAWAQAKADLSMAQLFNALKITAYFDGKTCVGFEGKITNLLGQRSDLNVTVSHTPDEGDLYDRVLEAVYIDSRNREYGIRYKGSWTGNDLDCTEDGMLTLMNGGTNRVLSLRLRHSAEGDKVTDLLTVQGITFAHTREGKADGRQFDAGYRCDLLGFSLDLDLSYSKSDDRISTPKSTVLSDGSKEFFDKEALEKLESTLYDLQKTADRLEDKLDF